MVEFLDIMCAVPQQLEPQAWIADPVEDVSRCKY